MNELGKEIKLIAHMCSDRSIVWSMFLLWYMTQKNLPDISLYLLFDRKNKSFVLPNYIHAKKINVLHCEFNNNLDLLVKNTRNDFFNNSIFINSFVFPVNVLSNQVLDAFKNNKNFKSGYGFIVSDISRQYESLDFISDIKSDISTDFVSIKDGWGNFNMSVWLNRIDNPLVYDFRNNQMNQKEIMFSKFWNDAGKISNLFH